MTFKNIKLDDQFISNAHKDQLKKNKKRFPCIILKVNLQTKQTTTSLVKNITIDVEVERLRELCTSYH